MAKKSKDKMANNAKTPPLNLQLMVIQRLRNQRRRRRHIVCGTLVALVMFGIGISLLVLGFKFGIEDVWLLGAIFLGLVVLLFTVSSIAIAIPTYTAYRDRRKIEREKLRLEGISFQGVYYEKVNSSPESGDTKVIKSRTIESFIEKETETTEDNVNDDQDDVACDVDIEVKVPSRTSSASSLLEKENSDTKF